MSNEYKDPVSDGILAGVAIFIIVMSVVCTVGSYSKIFTKDTSEKRNEEIIMKSENFHKTVHMYPRKAVISKIEACGKYYFCLYIKDLENFDEFFYKKTKTLNLYHNDTVKYFLKVTDYFNDKEELQLSKEEKIF